jgi:hypothetical protein
MLASLSMAALLAAMTMNLATMNVVADEPGREAATFVGKSPRIDQFDKYFALSLKPDTRANSWPQKARAHDIVVLFDTSASQNGEFRERALSVLHDFLVALDKGEQVRLFAVDVEATPLTERFVSPHGKEMQAALQKLRDRVPLGSTDMPAALKAAAAAHEGGNNEARAVIYVGDGMSVGGMVSADEMRELTNLLVGKRIPVSSFAVGPRIDAGLLAALANHTGGVVGFDSGDAKKDAAQRDAGAKLAAAATEVVVWPEKFTLPESFKEVYPRRMPPLRGDRDTVVVGVGRAAAPFEVRMSGDVAGKKQDFAWSIHPTAANEDNAYLALVVENAQASDGVLLATVGSAGLDEARRIARVQAHQFRNVAGQVAKAQPGAARVLNDHARRLDPAPLRGELHFVQAEVDGKAPGDKIEVQLGEEPRGPRDGDLLGDEIQRRRIRAEKLIADVTRRLQHARQVMAADPERAKTELKLALDQVKSDLDLDAGPKRDLLQQIEATMQLVSREQAVMDKRVQQEQAAAAQRAENQRLQGELVDREKQISQWMAKFDSLMEEKKFTQAESVADLAMAVAPNNAEIANAGLNATMRRAIEDGYFLRTQRMRGVLATLREVEYSHIPTPDEPPITYPPKEWWDAMSKRREEYKAVSLASESPAEKKIQEELLRPTQFQFNETPLKDVVTFIKDLHGINIELDRKKLEDAGVNPDDTLITRNLSGVSLKAALKLVLEQLGLAYVIKNEVLVITSKDDADAYLITKVYPVGDLVVPIESPLSFGGGLGGGGFGQGGGQFGGGQFGGQGGGGFGGGGQFGGGGGGQFGGGGGGGFFNVPSKPFRAFNPKRPPIRLEAPQNREVRPVAESSSVVVAEPISVKLSAGETADAAWNRYFSEHKNVPQESIRATLRQLREAKKYGDVVTVIQAALRAGQSQPWMYEAMALAMFAAGSKPEEMERTLMSAADFAGNSTELVYLAQYMHRSMPNYFGEEARQRFLRRSLKLFQQAVRAEPSAIDAYVHGLNVAKRLNDIEGIRWAAVGLLGQAWGPADEEVCRSVERVARATIQQLRLEKRGKEAHAFENALAQALRRDVVVVISWTGEADVDLMVEEPGGSICSANNTRTTSGGMHVGDSWENGDSIQGRQSEAYVCPQGFSGEYRVLVRRVFGKPTTGKVKIEVVKHFKARRENLLERAAETAVVYETVGDEDVVLPFTLDGGRRTEPLNEQRLRESIARAGEARDQMARELWESTDPKTYAQAQEAAKRRQAGDPRRRPPRGGAPGFQPVIVVLPEGAQFRARAVISGDRRYVRVTASPFFSFISEVNTFNFVTGQSGTSNGGGGGGGFGGGGGNQFGGNQGGGGGILGGGGGGGF